MTKSKTGSGCCKEGEQSCCKVESLIAVDERGQMVLPKELRERAGIKAGDKLALISFESGGEFCCLALMKAENLAMHVKNFLGPILGNLTK
jgi:antitoxin PrlF